MWLLEQGWSSTGHWPGLARLSCLLTATYPYHSCLTCAASPAVLQPALPPARAQQALTRQRSFIIPKLHPLTTSQSSQLAPHLLQALLDEAGHGSLVWAELAMLGALQQVSANLFLLMDCPTVSALFTLIYSEYICIYIIHAALTNAG